MEFVLIWKQNYYFFIYLMYTYMTRDKLKKLAYFKVCARLHVHGIKYQYKFSHDHSNSRRMLSHFKY